ncbi:MULTISPECIES: hypothetical protein [Vibrio]|nr:MULTISPECIES: hypothetical protein [Vibrio]MCG9660987.1 hypothetical protein [Vibrio mediterranei]
MKGDQVLLFEALKVSGSVSTELMAQRFGALLLSKLQDLFKLIDGFEG